MEGINSNGRAVAFLDILGFKNALEQITLSALAQKYENLIRLAETLNRPVSHPSSQPTLFQEYENGSALCERFVFSDSIILVSLDEKPINVLKLLVHAWRLSQVFLTAKLPLRGGIAYGELYTNPTLNVCLGKALTKAYELEKRQDWIGISIDNSIVENFPDLFQGLLNDLFFEYQVPCKNKEKVLFRTLNWRFNLVVKNGTRSLFDQTDLPDVQRKQKNTLDYAKAVSESGRVYVKDQEAFPLELRTFFVGDTEPPFLHGDEW
jgi:hypothetical protein